MANLKPSGVDSRRLAEIEFPDGLQAVALGCSPDGGQHERTSRRRVHWRQLESPMSTQQNVVHSQKLADGISGELIRFSREDVGWEWMSMSARRLKPGETFSAT